MMIQVKSLDENRDVVAVQSPLDPQDAARKDSFKAGCLSGSGGANIVSLVGVTKGLLSLR